MATQKTGIQITLGAGATMAAEGGFRGDTAPVHFAHEGRIIPIQGASINQHVATAPTASSVDLLTLKPASANYLRLYVASGAQVGFWDNGLDPVVTNFENRLGGDNYYDFPNVMEMPKLFVCGIATAAPMALQWGQTT